MPPACCGSATPACRSTGHASRANSPRSRYYGVDGKFAIRSDQTGDVACTAANFGSDPAPGAAKRCYLLLVDPASAVPAIDAAPLRTGATARYAPVVGLTGASYRWDFGDGSAPTAYSTGTAASHTYTAPGVYTVTLTVRDANGQVGTRTFVQAVTAAPSASSPLLLEARSAAATRLWVVNPDNDSVTVFDTVANSRVQEIPVGVAPRSLARAADGNVWVVNRDSASISVIDPASLTVVRTIALPRASQPWGLVSASDGRMYVSLEAAGRLLKLDGTGATLATLDVGANPRHLAVSGDASRVLVSRFITPPLAGEATAVVDTSTGGGEMLAVNTATMALAGTVRLRHGDRNDNEVQGSGIPNYLGPAVIAPDGGSAWVPSKQDNIRRGLLRNGQNWTSRTRCAPSARASTSRHWPKMPPRASLYVHNFMARTVSVVDVSPLTRLGELRSSLVATLGSVATEKLAGKNVFLAQNCAGCHSGLPFTASADATQLKNVGTLKPTSGKRLGGALPGIDVPTLRDVWATGPFLHDGSAPTLADAVKAHNGTTVMRATWRICRSTCGRSVQRNRRLGLSHRDGSSTVRRIESLRCPLMKCSHTRPASLRPRRWTAWLAATAMALLVPSVEASPSMSCNGSLVGKGDSPVSLLQKCGEPIYRQTVCVSMLQLGWVVTPYRSGGPSAILANQCVPMEEWTYDRGQGAFFGVVRIYNGTIESVRDGDRNR